MQIDYDPATFARELGLDPTQITEDGVTVEFGPDSSRVLLKWAGIKVTTAERVNAAMAASIQAAQTGARP